VLGEDASGLNVEGDSADAVCLRHLLSESAGHLDDGTGDGERPCGPVDAFPADGAEFPSAGSGRDGEVQKPCELGIARTGCVEERHDLVDLGRLDPCGLCSGWRRVGGRIRADPAPADGLAEGPADDGVDLTDGGGREPSSGDERSVEVVELCRAEAVGSPVADGGEDVLVQQDPVRPEGGRAEVVLGEGEPAVGDVSEGGVGAGP